MTDIPIYADPEVMSQNMIIFAVSQSESLRVRKDQVLVGEVTIVPLVQGQAKPELAAVAEEVEVLVATEARRRANSRPFRGRGRHGKLRRIGWKGTKVPAPGRQRPLPPDRACMKSDGVVQGG